MKRIQYHSYGGPEVLKFEEFSLPAPHNGEVRVRIKAAAMNPMDWKLRKGEAKPMTGRKFPRGLGHDFAGVVESVGPDVKGLKVGDEVFGSTPLKQAGTFAEALVISEKFAFPKPKSQSFEEAAALPIVSATAWNALISKARLKAGEKIFIAGCVGGVGRIGVQLARMQGAEVVGTCSAARREEALALGVGEVVNYNSFEVGKYRHVFDVVFDTVGAFSLRQCDAMLKPQGMALHIVPTPLKMIFSLLPTHHHVIFGNPRPETMSGITDAVEKGKVVPAIGRVVPLSEAIPAIIEVETQSTLKNKLIIVPT